MKKRTAILLPACLWATLIFGQVGMAGYKDIGEMRSYPLHVIIPSDTMHAEYAKYIRDVVAENWTFGKYEFVEGKKKGAKNIMYLQMASPDIDRNGYNQYFFITRSFYVNSVAFYDAYVPLGMRPNQLGKEHLASYLRVLQATLEATEKNQLKKMSFEKADELYSKEKGRLKGMKLYVSNLTLPGIGRDLTIADIKKHYPYEVELVTEARLEEILASKEKNAAYLNAFGDATYLTVWAITTDTAEVLGFEYKPSGLGTYNQRFLGMLEKLVPIK